MRIQHAAGLALLVGAILGFFLTFTPQSDASRNASGTYSLPSGNPVTSGTTISSTWANNTLSDISTELTSSLDRAGRGAMTAPLQLANGTSAAPALTWGTDPDSGLYRVGAGEIGMNVDAVRGQRWTSTGSNFDTDVLAVDYTNNRVGVGTASPAVALEIAQSVSGAALERIKNTHVSGYSTLDFYDSSSAQSGSIGYANASAATLPSKFFINALNGLDLTLAANGVARVLMKYASGYLDLAGQSAPASSDAIVNTITKKNVAKAWITFTITGGFGVGNFSVATNDGFNVTSVTRSTSTDFVVTWAGDFTDTKYAIFSDVEFSDRKPILNGKATGTSTFHIRDIAGASFVDLDAFSDTYTVDVLAFGAN